MGAFTLLVTSVPLWWILPSSNARFDLRLWGLQGRQPAGEGRGEDDRGEDQEHHGQADVEIALDAAPVLIMR